MALSTLLNDEDFFAPFFRTTPLHAAVIARSGDGARHIPVDVSETEGSYQVKADIPGVNKSDIKVHVDGDVLRLSVEKSVEQEEDKEHGGVKWHRYERSTAFTGRALRMPDNADLTHVKARYVDGVLHLDIAKKQLEEGAKQIRIE